MKIAFITLSPEGMKVIDALRGSFPDARAYAHEVTGGGDGFETFSSVVELTGRIFGEYEGLVYVGPCGAVVRALCGNARDKLSDPAVVVVDVGGRYAISLLSGHEGGANGLAVRVANAIGAEPVVTTTTDARKNVIVGVGCRRGKEKGKIIDAIKTALDRADLPLERVRLIASADIKADEKGLIEAAGELGVPARFIASDEIRGLENVVGASEFVQKSVNLPAVAEPAALLAGRRTKLIQRKMKLDGVTVAIVLENCSSLA